jgi:hypothetical protein
MLLAMASSMVFPKEVIAKTRPPFVTTLSFLRVVPE